MTRQEACEKYEIPLPVLEAYERAMCGVGGQACGEFAYGDEDLERLSTILTLQDIGFADEETETYMRLLLRPDSADARLRMMEEKREQTLEKIHFYERKLARLDYLRREIQKQKKG